MTKIHKSIYNTNDEEKLYFITEPIRLCIKYDKNTNL
ncbi:hypothetical protein CHRY9390_00651 [Chryseobacterium aquaeductus]|uniref:Uncharacterized protein n=1 Tax=Chryseobacterium aquaeductus TaxID=2675056 RepID=A0A9N8MF33_9FLAO|nr:hypothetical protein CHRY9390_00651 [Chryseobacterium potabilaquae]CAD7800586.1 hypothetical protein CHRY9390_00651 [Chryseobacterium aquaeductus]